MPDAIITSTASTFGTITGTFAADQSTITGTVTGIITGTLDGSVGVPGVGVPDGGTTGQVLQKATNTSYDTVWATPSGGAWGTITGTLSNQTDLQTALNLKAPLASPAFTGNPTAPTAALGDNDTSLATTAFVQQELLSGTANAKNLEVYVRNQTGSTIPAGSIVYINGATGNRPTITLAQANNDANSAQTFGFVKTSIANNGFGYVIVRGELENIDTSALTEGVQLYLSPTTAGTWTTAKPSAPQHLVYVGICVRAHPTQGVILVAVQNGYELNELHDVQITSPTNGQVLKYNSSTSLWYNGLDVGVPAGGTAGQFLTKIDGTDYNTDWTTVNLSAYAVKANNLSDLTSAPDARTNLGLGTMATATASDYSTTTVANGLYYPLSTNPAGYLTSSSLTPYLTKADNLGSLTNFATARDNLGLGTLNNPTFAGVTVQGAGANIANLTATSLSLTHATSGSFTIQPSVGITFPDASVQTTAYTGAAPGYITSVSSPLSVTSGNLSVDLSAYLTSATAASTYAPLAGATFTGEVITPASTTSNAGLTITPGVAPTSPTNGEIWMTNTGVFARVSGATRGLYSFDASTNKGGSLNVLGFVTASGNPSLYSTETSIGPTGLLVRDTTTSVPIARFADYEVLIPSVGITFSDATVQTTAFTGLSGYATESWVTAGFYPLTGNPSSFLVAADIADLAPLASPALTGNVTITSNSTGAALFIEQAGTGNILTLHDQASDTTFVAIDANGKVNTIASTTTNAGFNVPHGAAPTTPVNGDIWTTTSGLVARINNGNRTMAMRETANSYAAGAKQTVSHSTTNAGLRVTPVAGDPSTLLDGDVWHNLTTLKLVARVNGVSQNIATESFVTSQGYITSSALTGYATESWVTTALGSYLTTASAASTYQTIAGMSSYLTTASAASTYAPLASPALTGNPTAPTPATADNDTSIATTAFVKAQGYLTSAPVTSVAGKTGAVTLVNTDISGLGTMSTASAADYSTTTVANGLYYPLASNPAGYLTSAPVTSVAGRTGAVTLAVADVSGAAPLASPALTGTPTAPTATAGTSTTQLATTAFVTTADNLKANLASPTFTGTPTAPTATAGTNTTQIATTAFVTAAIPTNNVKAWVNFNGTGTVSIRGSANISSITDNGAGNYTLNFTTALADANYAVAGFAAESTFTVGMLVSNFGTLTQTTSAFRFNTTYAGSSLDCTQVHVTIIR